MSNHEYAVEIRRNLGNNVCQFVRQINCFTTLKEAKKCFKDSKNLLEENQFLSIIKISYNEEGEEIDIEFVE